MRGNGLYSGRQGPTVEMSFSVSPGFDMLPATPASVSSGAGVSADSSISVSVRVRPLNGREGGGGSGSGGAEVRAGAWHLTPTTLVSEDDVGTRSFTIDRVLPPATTNEGVYEAVAQRVVAAALRGVNGTVLCYGQTGSGKTHSMLGGSGGDAGMLPRALRDIFAYVEADTAAAAAEGRAVEWMVRLSYIEVYQEEINDLLQPLARGRGRALKILGDDAQRGASACTGARRSRGSAPRCSRRNRGRRTWGRRGCIPFLRAADPLPRSALPTAAPAAAQELVQRHHQRAIRPHPWHAVEQLVDLVRRADGRRQAAEDVSHARQCRREGALIQKERHEHAGRRVRARHERAADVQHEHRDEAWERRR